MAAAFPDGTARIPEFLRRDGEAARLIAAYDWSGTSLGPLEGWPPSLRSAVGMVVHSAVPIVMLWGEDGVMIYNDAYSVFAGGRHPALLGMKVREAWSEVADFNDHVMKVGLAGGTLAYRDQELTLYRPGRPEQAWMNLDYSPLLDDAGKPAGVIAIVIETTDRVMAERGREAAETTVRRVLETMAEGFVLLDRDFRVLTINAEAMRLETAAREEILGKSAWEVWPGTEESALGEIYRRAMRERTPASLEHEYIWPDGTRAWLELRVYPSGEGLALFYRDVTERRRAEDRKTALLALGDGVRNLKDVALIAEVAGRVIGETLCLAQAAYVAVHPSDDSARVLRPWLRDDSVTSMEGRHRFSDFGPYADRLHRGHDVIVEDSRSDQVTPQGRRVLDLLGIASFVNIPLIKDGRMAGMILASDDRPRTWDDGDLAFMRSVADRTWAALQTAHAEASLLVLNRDLEAQVRERTADRDRVWANSRDLLVTLGADGVFRAVSPAWAKTLGHSPEEVVGQAFKEFVHADDIASTKAALAGAIERRDLTNFENRYRHKDGTLRWISWNTSTEGGTLYAYGRDVTAEKEQAEALRSAEEQLRQSQKMEAVGQLTGGLAHDFNNLLTAMSGSLELLQARIAESRLDDLERYVTSAQGASRRAAALTHRLLAFSRRQTLDPKPVNLHRLVLGMEELIRGTVGPAIAVEVTDCAGEATVLADPNQLENALLNLCINARDAMPNGGRLTLACAENDVDERRARDWDMAPGRYLSLSVGDTGTGMTPEVARRAFDPFYTTKPIGSGTGLGLSMIYGFVRQSGGQARITSIPSEGTVVSLHLPYHQASSPDDGDVAGDDRVVTGALHKTVLVVDDEPIVRMLLTEVLQDLGCDALEAGDGTEALAHVRSGARIDLIVSDVGLPGELNGRQIADAARALRPGLKVLFITGYAEKALVGDGLLEDGMHVMTKPFGMDAIAARIGRLLADA